MKGKLKIGVRGRLERNVFYSPDGCWLWLGQKRPDEHGGYGTIKIDGRLTRAHRVSYETFKGPIPAGLFVCHTCDIPLCINPDHLFVGTLQDNNLDMYRKGRNAKFFGDDNVRSKLKEWHIKYILQMKRSKHYTNLEIATVFKVGERAIIDVMNGRTWSHVTGFVGKQTTLS